MIITNHHIQHLEYKFTQMRFLHLRENNKNNHEIGQSGYCWVKVDTAGQNK